MEAKGVPDAIDFEAIGVIEAAGVIEGEAVEDREVTGEVGEVVDSVNAPVTIGAIPAIEVSGGFVDTVAAVIAGIAIAGIVVVGAGVAAEVFKAALRRDSDAAVASARGSLAGLAFAVAAIGTAAVAAGWANGGGKTIIHPALRPGIAPPSLA